MNKERIAIITEGDVRELDVMNNIKSIFFKSERVDIIAFPAGENIYMLWKQLKEDDFQTDIIELIREQNPKAAKTIKNYTRDDFSEVYLFFDYDGHQDNLKNHGDGEDVLEEMLSTFNNETEDGLLYINYPMVESVRDYVENECKTLTGCYVNLSDIGKYKNLSSRGLHNNTKQYTILDWEKIIDIFIMRLCCLADDGQLSEYEYYKRVVVPEMIYGLQGENIENNRIFVLCAFSEFLLDYNKANFWHRMVKHKGMSRKCELDELKKG